LKGTQYYAAKQHNEAVKAYEACTTVDPFRSEAWANLGTLLQSQPDKSRLCFMKAIMLDPTAENAANALSGLDAAATSSLQQQARQDFANVANLTGVKTNGGKLYLSTHFNGLELGYSFAVAIDKFYQRSVLDKIEIHRATMDQHEGHWQLDTEISMGALGQEKPILVDKRWSNYHFRPGSARVSSAGVSLHAETPLFDSSVRRGDASQYRKDRILLWRIAFYDAAHVLIPVDMEAYETANVLTYNFTKRAPRALQLLSNDRAHAISLHPPDMYGASTRETVDPPDVTLPIRLSTTAYASTTKIELAFRVRVDSDFLAMHHAGRLKLCATIKGAVYSGNDEASKAGAAILRAYTCTAEYARESEGTAVASFRLRWEEECEQSSHSTPERSRTLLITMLHDPMAGAAGNSTGSHSCEASNVQTVVWMSADIALKANGVGCVQQTVSDVVAEAEGTVAKADAAARLARAVPNVLTLRTLLDRLALHEHERRVYAQNGEDGLLERLFSFFGNSTNSARRQVDAAIHEGVQGPQGRDVGRGYYVEFGVEDGSECNTRWLREAYGWQGLMMDGSHSTPSIGLAKEWISAEAINDLFAKHGVPKAFDLLSIDIDYNDYWVWRAIKDSRFRPRVVIVEVNAGIPSTEARTVAYDDEGVWDGPSSSHFGASVLAFHWLGRARDYTLIYCESHGVNCFFVANELLRECGVAESELGHSSEDTERSRAAASRTYHKPNYDGEGKRHSIEGLEDTAAKPWVWIGPGNATKVGVSLLLSAANWAAQMTRRYVCALKNR
jgi:hypothetical protein